jgi:hypothetical protein
MKTVSYTRVARPGTVSLCEMQFNKDATVTLKFGKKHGGNLKLPSAFLADSIEHYLNHLVEVALKEMSCPSKKVPQKKQSRKTLQK